MQNRHYNFCRWDLLNRMNIDRYSSSIIDNRHRIIDMNRHFNVFTVTGHRLVDGLINDCVDEVVQARRTGRTYVYGRTLADTLQSFKNLDLLCRIGVEVARLALSQLGLRY